MALPGKSITQLITDYKTTQKKEDLNDLMVQVYAELKKIAKSQLRKNAHNQSLTPTALVHEVFLNFVAENEVNINDRKHFFALVAQAMHWFIKEKARAQRAQKRGAGAIHIALDRDVDSGKENAIDVVLFDELLDELGAKNPRLLKVVELRFFTGLTVTEAAEVLEISPETVKRDWALAKAWLGKKMK